MKVPEALPGNFAHRLLPSSCVRRCPAGTCRALPTPVLDLCATSPPFCDWTGVPRPEKKKVCIFNSVLVLVVCMQFVCSFMS